MQFKLHHILFALLSIWLTVSFSLSLHNAPLAINGTRSLALGKRGYNSCRSKCSAKSCCQLPQSDSNEEDTEAQSLPSRSLNIRALFPINQATLDADIVRRFTDKKVKLIFDTSDDSDDSTSAWKPITTKSRPFDLGLSALCGCTTLIVHSDNGAYGAHFFEAAAWGLGDDAFQEYVVNFLKGSVKGQGGLAEFAARLTKGSTDVAAYILTPQDELADEDPNAPGYVPDVAMYGDQIQKLVDLLPTIIPGLRDHIQVNLYQALEGGQSDGEDKNPEQAQLLDNTSRGRVLFQYDPQNNGFRSVRLFFESTQIFHRNLGPAV